MQEAYQNLSEAIKAKSSTGSAVVTVWPPESWPQFSDIQNPEGTAVESDDKHGLLSGINYRFLRTGHTFNKKEIYKLEIDYWKYCIRKGPLHIPALEFAFMERKDTSSALAEFIGNLKTMSCPLRVNDFSAMRAVMAAVFLIRQAESGRVPEVEKILRIYRLHPDQSHFYTAGG